MAALADAKRRGLTRHIGVSNFPAKLLTEAWAVTGEPLVADQCEYHPEIDQDATIAECRRRGTAFVSYSPLARRAVLRNRAIAGIAARLGRTPAQVVLRWHIQQGCVAIPKSGDPKRIRENFGVFDFALEPADMAAIDALRR
jgi:diketogulonate reductase-like aldo/keto reductase